LLLIGVGLYAFAPHAPAIPKQVADVAELERYLNQLAGPGNPAGFSVVVVKDGKVVFSNAFGYMVSAMRLSGLLTPSRQQNQNFACGCHGCSFHA
jgi:hypothetical protein